MPNQRALIISASIGTDTSAFFLSSNLSNHVSSLTHKRVWGESGNALSMTVVDSAAFDIENKIILSPEGPYGTKQINYQYGYEMKPGRISPIFTGSLYDYKLQISGNVSTLDLIAVSMESRTILNSKPVNYGQSGEPIAISDIVIRIAYENDWVLGEIEPTGTVTDSFTKSYESPMAFINTQLIPKAISKTTGKGNYICYFTTSITGKTVVNFKSLNAIPTTAETYTYMQNGNDYIYNNINSTVLSWSPAIAGSSILDGGNSVVGSALDEDTGDQLYANASAAASIAEYYGASYLSANNYIAITPSSSTQDTLDAATKSAQSIAMNRQYTANARILGAPTRKIGEYIDFNIISKYNKIHYSSGRYQCIELTDSISSGGYFTEMNLLKNANYTGTTPGFTNTSNGTTVTLVRDNSDTSKNTTNGGSW